MAIYHLNTHTIGRAAGHSAVAAAAYRSASSLVDERTGEAFDFTRKGGVLSSEIVTPEGVPVPERAALWNAAEAAEKRKDARVAREWRAALPHELNDADRKELATRMGQAIADRYGVAVDVCIHAPDKDGDDRNFHVHMLATTRTIGEDGTLGAKAVIELANKDRQKAGIPGTSQGDITDIRRQWGELTNEALERAEISARVDHRSYADQGVELTPTKHIGRDAVAMDRRGLDADRIDMHNADRQEQAQQITERPEIILDKITATQAVFTRRDIAAELNRYIDDADQFQGLLTRLENSPLLVEMEPASGREPAKFSTREMIDTERGMVDSAERLAQAGRHGVSSPITNAAIDGAGTLSAEQQNAVRHVLKPGSLAVVIGDAGTGKSFSMKVAREAWQAQGLNVRGAALAGKAADELQAGSGIDSRTLASLEFAWKNGKDKLTSRDVLIIDSWTELVTHIIAADRMITNPADVPKLEWDDYGKIRLLLDLFLANMSKLNCHVIVIGHSETVASARKMRRPRRSPKARTRPRRPRRRSLRPRRRRPPRRIDRRSWPSDRSIVVRFSAMLRIRICMVLRESRRLRTSDAPSALNSSCDSSCPLIRWASSANSISGRVRRWLR